MQILISVVICTYNRADMLRRALETVVCQETGGQFSYEVVLIDDGSTDSTSGVVREVASRSRVPVRYLREEGHGIAHARNRGIGESRGEWIASFDDDQLAEPDWLNQLFTVASRTGADCVAGNLELALPAWPVIPLCRVTRSLLGEQSREEARVRSRTFFPGAGNMLIRRSVLDRIGSFDVSMVRGGEDDDLARRIFAQGFKVWSAPKAVARHSIPPYRLSAAYFRSASFRVGVTFACIDSKQRGRGRTALLCIARIGQALLINTPLLLRACLSGDRAEMLG